jgi:N-glycosylase/DNA lyase
MGEQYTSLQNKKFLIDISDTFSLEKTITCGQTFRYECENGKYIYPFKNSLLEIREINRKLSVSVFGKEQSEHKIKELLGLNHDIQKINIDILENAPTLAQIVEAGNGIRIMKNSAYETALSFIFSIQTSIPIIRRRLNILSEMAGDSIDYNGRKYYTFPTSSPLRRLSNADLGLLHLGFREQFVKKFIEYYDEEFFEKLSRFDFEEKRKTLLGIRGIGEKVAQCILLFGFGELSAFPVDVWIERAMKSLFNFHGSTKKMTEEGRHLFGNFAGYAQQYIYYFIRIFGVSCKYLIK